MAELTRSDRRWLGLARKQGDLVFYLLMMAASVWYAWPYVEMSLVPCMDSPAHLALSAAMQHLGQSGHILDATFRWGEFPAPNSTYYLVAWSLGSVIDLLKAERLIILLYIVGLPWAFLYFVRSFNRSRWLAFVAFPLALSWPFTEGFLDYCLGLVLVFWGLGAVRRYLARYSPWRMFTVFWVSGLVFITHIQAFVYYGAGCVVLLALVAWQRFATSSRRRAALTVLRDGLVIGSLGLMVLAGWLAGSGEGLVGGAGHQDFTEVSVHTKLLELFSSTLLVLSGDRDSWIVVILLAMVGLFRLLILLLGRQELPAGTAERLIEQVPGLLLLLFGIAYAFLPLDFGLYYNLYNRIPAFLMLLAASLIAPPRVTLVSGWRGLLVALPLMVAVVYPRCCYEAGFDRLDNLGADFWEVLEQAPGQSRLLYYVEFSPGSGFDSYVIRHLDQYHTVVNQGVTSFSFANHPGRVIVQRRLGFDVEVLDRADLERPGLFAGYDVLLQCGQEQLENRGDTSLSLVARRGLWSLYSIAGAPGDPGGRSPAPVGDDGPEAAPFAWSCDPGQALIGLQGRIQGEAIAGFRPRCRRVQSLARGERRRGVSMGPIIGVYLSTERFTLACPDGHAVVGIHGKAGEALHQLGLDCAPLEDRDGLIAMGPPSEPPETVAGQGGEPFSALCPEGNLGTGFRGRSADLILALDVTCFPLEALASGTTP